MTGREELGKAGRRMGKRGGGSAGGREERKTNMEGRERKGREWRMGKWQEMVKKG